MLSPSRESVCPHHSKKNERFLREFNSFMKLTARSHAHAGITGYRIKLILCVRGPNKKNAASEITRAARNESGPTVLPNIPHPWLIGQVFKSSSVWCISFQVAL